MMQGQKNIKIFYQFPKLQIVTPQAIATFRSKNFRKCAMFGEKDRKI